MRHLPGCWALLHQPNWTRLWAERAKSRDFSEFYRETVPLSWKFGVGGVPCIFHSSVTHWPVVSCRRSKSLGHLQERWDDTGPQHCRMCVWPQLAMKLSKLLGFLWCFYGFSYVPTTSLMIIRPINPFCSVQVWSFDPGSTQGLSQKRGVCHPFPEWTCQAQETYAKVVPRNDFYMIFTVYFETVIPADT